MSKNKKPNKRDWPLAELLVHRCYQRHAPEVSYTPYPLGTKGKDVLVAIRGVMVDLQVKTSDNTQTTGLVLPVRERSGISERMEVLLTRHITKNPDIFCVMFVGKPVHGKSEEGVIKDIWRETVKILKETERRVMGGEKLGVNVFC